MTAPRVHSPDNPFAKKYSAENPFAQPSTSLGPVEVVGVEEEAVLRDRAARGDIAAALTLGTRQSNRPAMAQSQAAIDQDAARNASGVGTAFHLAADAGASVLFPGADDPRAMARGRIAEIENRPFAESPESEATSFITERVGFPRVERAPRDLTPAELAQVGRLMAVAQDPNVRGATERLDAFTAAGGDPTAPLFGEAVQDAFRAHPGDAGPTVADAFGLASAGGAVASTTGINAALPNVGQVRSGMSLKQIAAELLKGGVSEGGTGALLAAVGGADPEEIARQGVIQGVLGASFRALHGAPAINEAIANRPRPTGIDVDLDVLSGREGARITRETPAEVTVSRDALGNEITNRGRTIRASMTPEQVGESMRAAEAQRLENPATHPVTGQEFFDRHLQEVGLGDVAAEAALRARIETEPVPALGEAGTGAPRLLAGTAGGIGGAAYGATQGDTPEERAKNALLYGLGGLALGVAAGYAAERIGANRAVREIERAPDLAPARAGRLGTRLAERRGVRQANSRSDFGAAPSPEALRTPRESAPVTNPTPYVNLEKFGLDAEGQGLLRAEAERIGTELQGNPRRVATWDEWRQAAASIGIDDLNRSDYRAWGEAELLAVRNILAANTDRLTALDKVIADVNVSPMERNRALLEQQHLSVQTDTLLRKFIPARTQTARNMNSLKMIASRNFEPTWWLAKAHELAGRPLTDAEYASIRGFLDTQDRPGLVQFLSKLRKATPGQKLVTYWKANLLTNPKTHIVNTVSNAALGGLEIAKDAPGALFDRALGLSTGQRSLAGPSLVQFKAAKEGAIEGAREAMKVLRGEPTAETLLKYDIPRETNFDNPVLDGYTKGVFRLLGAADRIPRQAAMRRALANQAEVLATAQGLTGEARLNRVQDLIQHPTTEMSMRAITEAEEAVVQDQTRLGRGLSALVREAPALEYVIPFRRTPGAVAARIGEYTFGLPYGMAKVVYQAGQGKLAGMSLAEQRALSQLLGRGATGLGLLTAGMLLYRKGLLTPPQADFTVDRGQNETDQMRGVQGNSLVLKVNGEDVQIEVGRLSPAGNLLAIGALAAQAAGDRDPETSPWGAAALGGLKVLTDQPFLQGLETLKDVKDQPGKMGGKFAGNLLRGLVPASGLAGGVARAVDPTVRSPQTIGERVATGVPGLSEGVSARIGPLGDDQEREGGLMGVASELFLPGRVRTVQHDPALDALGEYQVTVTSVNHKQDEEQSAYEERARRVGGYRREEIEATLNSQEWEADTSFEGRQELLKSALDRASRRAARDTRSRTLSPDNPFAGTP